MSEEISRRRFLETAAVTVAGTQFATSSNAGAVSDVTGPPNVPVASQNANNSFDAIKQIDAGVLNVGYAESGPTDGPVVILIHGWPYDIHSFVDVVPMLTAKGYRVIVPFLRGYGTTRFLSSDSVRNGQPSA